MAYLPHTSHSSENLVCVNSFKPQIDFIVPIMQMKKLRQNNLSNLLKACNWDSNLDDMASEPRELLLLLRKYYIMIIYSVILSFLSLTLLRVWSLLEDLGMLVWLGLVKSRTSDPVLSSVRMDFSPRALSSPSEAVIGAQCFGHSYLQPSTWAALTYWCWLNDFSAKCPLPRWLLSLCPLTVKLLETGKGLLGEK